jgi:pentatricopeptide repeat protein
VAPNENSYHAAISVCEKGSQWHLALNWLNLMLKVSVVPEALNLLCQMPEARVMPNEITYNAAISAGGKGGQWQLALYCIC